MARNIKTGDQVMVIAGAAKGKTGRVLKILGDKNKVVVEGVNRVWKHMKPNRAGQQGGRIQKDAPIALSNIMPIDPATGKPARVRFQDLEGKKHRMVAVKGGVGTDLGVVGR